MGIIKGCRNWKNPDNKYIQSNNVLEKLNPNGYEYCGPTASVMIMACMGKLPKQTKGIQAEDLLSLFMNTEDNEIKAEFQKYRKIENYPYNRVPQFYPYAVKMVFGNNCYYIGSNFLLEQTPKDIILQRFIDAKFITFKAVQTLLERQQGVQLCLKNPGHYISAIAFDFTSKEIIYNDPWPNRKGLKNNGLHERMNETEFLTNVHKWCIVYK